MKDFLLGWVFVYFSLSMAQAQPGTIRGNLVDLETGEAIALGNVVLRGTALGDQTDFEGFFTIPEVPPGEYTLLATYLGYDTLEVELEVGSGEIVYRRLFMEPGTIDLTPVDVSGRRARARDEVQLSEIELTSNEIKELPATGGEADIAQYLSVLPGIVLSGDQGGQLYIRGGSPVQNKILLDGMTIYNPFHSIGLFSVFETETIQRAEVRTAAFNAEQGGRISAVVDIHTRPGNKKRFGGLLSASPFQAKALLEGPIRKLRADGGGSISFLLTGKHSYLDQSSKIFYPYAADTSLYRFAADSTDRDIVLPFSYTDLYGKLTLDAGNGSELNIFGFHFDDAVTFGNAFQSDWTTAGAGLDFRLMPPQSNLILDGTIAYSDYNIRLTEPDGSPRQSSLVSYTAALNFSYFGGRDQLNYGFEFHGFNTDFRFENPVGIGLEQQDFTTELSGYLKYRRAFGNLIIEPGFRLHFYASQPALSPEPRLGIKYRLSESLRLKAGGGLYSQNLVSAVNERDVVNFFVGFLAGPEETIFEPGSREPAPNGLQRAIHGALGLEADLSRRLELQAEGYYKHFSRLIGLNRNKLSGAEPDFSTETGDAYGVDMSLRYEDPQFSFWLAYSLAYAFRNDGFQNYPAVFDRRHNLDLLVTYAFGRNRNWEVSARWNLGTGFPFTQTQGFYQAVPFEDKLQTDVLTGNYNLDFILSDTRNGGRLPVYHRLDLSLKKVFFLSVHSQLEARLSLTNVYDRGNVFFVDRVTNRRVNQLPFLYSVGLAYTF